MIWEMFRLFRTLTQPEDYRDCQVALSNSSISQLQQEFTNLQAKSLETQVKLTQCSSPWECRHPEQAQISQRELLALRICKIRQTQIQKTEQHQTNQNPKTENSFTELRTCNPEECSEPKDFRYSAPCASLVGFFLGHRHRHRSLSLEDCSTLGCTSS